MFKTHWILVVLLVSGPNSYGGADGAIPAEVAPGATVPAGPVGGDYNQTCKPFVERELSWCHQVLSDDSNAYAAMIQADYAGTNQSMYKRFGSLQKAGSSATGYKVSRAEACQVRQAKCIEICSGSVNYHNQQAQADQANAATHTQGAQASQETVEGLCPLFGEASKEKIADAMQTHNLSNEAYKGAEATKSGSGQGLKEKAKKIGQGMDLQTIGTGAAVIAGAMCLFGSLCGDDGDKEEDKLAEQDQPLDCSNPANHANEDCQEHYLKSCMVNPAAAGCKEFNGHYCGMKEGGDIMSATLPGAGSSYCSYQVATDYCKGDSVNHCPTCQELAMKKSETCANNPAVCLPTFSSAQLSVAKAQCPTDPLFLRPEYISIKAGSGTTYTGANPNVGNGTTPVDLRTLAGTGDGKPDYSEVIEDKGGVFTTFSVTTKNVGASMSRDLFKKSAEEIEELCRLGFINYCGPREGL